MYKETNWLGFLITFQKSIQEKKSSLPRKTAINKPHEPSMKETALGGMMNYWKSELGQMWDFLGIAQVKRGDSQFKSTLSKNWSNFQCLISVNDKNHEEAQNRNEEGGTCPSGNRWGADLPHAFWSFSLRAFAHREEQQTKSCEFPASVSHASLRVRLDRSNQWSLWLKRRRN